MATDRDHTELPFRKMHGLGNDFVIVDARGAADPISPALARTIGDRHRGVGFDQLAVILDGTGGADADITFYNSDGSTAGACGNATRCVARLLLSETTAQTLALRTERGLLSAQPAGANISVNMGPPITHWRDIPLARETDTTTLPLPGAPAACSMGNPHCTFFQSPEALATTLGLAQQITPLPDGLPTPPAPGPFATLGPAFERHPLFPERTNVQFADITSPATATVKVWERGVGHTLASGSSSCAVVVNAHRRGLMDRKATLTLDGGQIEIDWRDDGVWMTGPTTEVFTGTLSATLCASLIP